MRYLLCAALFFTAAVVLSSAQNYCNVQSCLRMNTQQTMCRYTNPNPAAACGKVRSVGPTQQERNQILNLHNSLRSYVAAGKEKRGSNGPQPGATNMQTMTWDSELETIAQRWANQCSFGHDACRNIDKYQVGQNVGIRSTTGNDDSTPSQIVQSWYDEVAKFDKNQVKALRDVNGVGHYTQMVWAETNKVGCGSVRYQANGWNSYYLVCNYGPTGNFIGLPVYHAR